MSANGEQQKASTETTNQEVASNSKSVVIGAIFVIVFMVMAGVCFYFAASCFRTDPSSGAALTLVVATFAAVGGAMIQLVELNNELRQQR